MGGSSAVVPDSKIGDGFDKILFSTDKLDDPDMAWKRVDPSDGHNVQLAVKISAIDKSRFFWRAWADAGVADPAKFDYNDSYSESQAGSPYQQQPILSGRRAEPDGQHLLDRLQPGADRHRIGRLLCATAHC